MLSVLDLFSGIGGFSLGLERAGGFKTIAFCEIDPFCRQVLAKHWPGVPIEENICNAEFGREFADVICGGFPCQDISQAGSGAGIAGERSGLWREYARIIGDVRPKYVVVENSAALLYRGFEQILLDLAAFGYDAEWHCLRASSIGAPFEGDRIYILATPNAVNGKARMGIRAPIIDARQIQLANIKYRSTVWMETTRRSARMGNGFSDRVDRRERTECLGNAVVPQIPELIGRAILAAEAAK